MRIPLAALSALLLSTLACGSLMRDPEPSPEKLSELRRQNDELRRGKTVAEVELARLRQEVTRLETELAAAREESGRLARQAAAAEEAAVAEEAAAAEPQMPAAVEEEELGDEDFEELREAAAGSPAAGSPAPESPAESPGEETETSAPQEVSAAARALYDESYTLFHERSYAAAEEGFRRFLELHPRTDLADNAQFWIGECRYSRGDYDDALAAFMGTVERYPGGNKVPDALYKAGKCLEALGDRQRAVATYEEVVRRFPDSAASVAAQERLADLR